jgi:hypothetical protein
VLATVFQAFDARLVARRRRWSERPPPPDKLDEKMP